MAAKKVPVAILGASGYTGADLVRLLVAHPGVDLKILTANAYAGQTLDEVFPHLREPQLGPVLLPSLIKIEDADWDMVDAVFCALPHGTSQEIVANLPARLRVIDLSADFRLRDGDIYAEWYGQPHKALALQPKAVYGLTEHAREAIKGARLVACPGCYPTATLLALLPLIKTPIIQTRDIIIDAKSGVSGAGRGPKVNKLFCEVAEAIHPYGVASHRHAPEIEQELGLVAGAPVVVNFTPHLVPMNRGELVTCYAPLLDGMTVGDARGVLEKAYAKEPFVHVLKEGEVPATRQVRGSNHCIVNVFKDRLPGRLIIIAAIDNLVKGSSGQAVQNFNLAYGMDETTALMQAALFP